MYEVSETLISAVNNILFRTESAATKINTLKQEIRYLRHEIYSKVCELNTLLSAGEVQEVTHTHLQTLCTMYPSIQLEIINSAIKMCSFGQTISFHCSRNTIHGNNNDILYVTSPAYHFVINFLHSGNITIEGTTSPTLTDSDYLHNIVDGITSCTYGHPHAQIDSPINAGTGVFSTICSGNNTFISDYDNFMKKPDPSTFISIMNRAMIWLTTANLGDMYGTDLYRRVSLHPWFYTAEAREFSDWFFTWMQTSHMEGSFMPEMLKNALYEKRTESNKHIIDDLLQCLARTLLDTDEKELLLFQYSYALWLATHPHLLTSERACLSNAVRTDVALFHHYCRRGNTNTLNSPELLRVADSIFKAPAELKLYRQHLMETGHVTQDPALDLTLNLIR